MKPFELIYALGDIDDALVADAAPVARKSVLTAPVWRWTAAAACVLLAAGVTWKLLPRDNDVVPNLSSTTAPHTPTTKPTQLPTASTTQSTATTQTSTTPSSGTTDWEGQGGYDLDLYWYANDLKFSGFHGFLLEYIYDTFTVEQIAEINSEMAVARSSIPYTYIGESIHFWVHELNIPSEKFIELNNADKEFHKNRPWELENKTFTDEEIDDIYNLTTEEFNKKYKAPTAVLVGKVIYNFNWLYKNDIDLWQKQNFTVEQLQEAVDNAKKMENFPQGIAEAVEKKLNEYIATMEVVIE